MPLRWEDPSQAMAMRILLGTKGWQTAITATAALSMLDDSRFRTEWYDHISELSYTLVFWDPEACRTTPQAFILKLSYEEVERIPGLISALHRHATREWIRSILQTLINATQEVPS